jgi:hypothetical protein
MFPLPLSLRRRQTRTTNEVGITEVLRGEKYEKRQNDEIYERTPGRKRCDVGRQERGKVKREGKEEKGNMRARQDGAGITANIERGSVC